jgi:hypothetical protein
MKKILHTLFPHLAPLPSHVDYAQAQLDDARLRLLDELKTQERVNANVEGLRRRINRLEGYVATNTPLSYPVNQQ